MIEAWLSQLKGQRVRVLRAQRGPRAEYMRLVHENAEQNLKAFLAHQEVQETASAHALAELATALDLPDVPHRIECYDISNIQGTNPVASMVVFVEGRAKKSDYRRFKIRYDQGVQRFRDDGRKRCGAGLRYLRADTNAPGEEDPASIIEDGAVDGAAKLEAQLRRKERFHHRPDLLLIDGGKGQLSAVVEVLEDLDLWGIPVAGLAKEHEWLFVPGNPEPIVLAAGFAGTASRDAHARRSAPFRRRIPPQAPRQSDDAIRARCARRRRAGPPQTPAGDVRQRPRASSARASMRSRPSKA